MIDFKGYRRKLLQHCSAGTGEALSQDMNIEIKFVADISLSTHTSQIQYPFSDS
jgi:hypothetical protein